jgi:hypothetical protein
LEAITPASSQDLAPDDRALFSAFTTADAHKVYLEKLFNIDEARRSKECPHLNIVEWDKTLMIEQPKFVRTGSTYKIASGQWMTLAILDRCGTRVTRRILLKAVPGAKEPQVMFLLPGEFRGNLALELDAKRIVLPGLAAHANCRDSAKLQVMEIKAYGPASAKGWSETWTANACGSLIDADVSYASPPSGGVNIVAGNFRAH